MARGRGRGRGGKIGEDGAWFVRFFVVSLGLVLYTGTRFSS